MSIDLRAEQYEQALSLKDSIVALANWQRFYSYRPKVSPKEDPRAWWRCVKARDHVFDLGFPKSSRLFIRGLGTVKDYSVVLFLVYTKYVLLAFWCKAIGATNMPVEQSALWSNEMFLILRSPPCGFWGFPDRYAFVCIKGQGDLLSKTMKVKNQRYEESRKQYCVIDGRCRRRRISALFPNSSSYFLHERRNMSMIWTAAVC